VDDERALKAEFRWALDDVLPPAPWLEAAVTADLRKRLSGRSQSRGQLSAAPTRTPRLVVQLAAGILIAALVAAAVVTFIHLRDQAPQSIPATPLSVAAYQQLVLRDNTLTSAAGNKANTACATLESVCPAPGHPLLTAMQRWLDDLNRTEPPARFAVIDRQLRRHVAANISDIEAAFAAYRARDANALDRANFAGSNEGRWEDALAASIFQSRDGTSASYTASLASAKLNFDGCGTCQSLPTVDAECSQIPALSCETDIFSMESAIGTVLAAVTRVTAPTPLAVQDAALQRDLALADTALVTMANANLVGDEAALNGGLLSLQRALPAVKADLTDILRS
jgi:hypothetical protein